MFFFGGLMIGIPILLIWFFQRRQAQTNLRWPSVPGKIVDSKVTQVRDSDGDMSKTAVVSYAYAVAGTPLLGSRVSIGNRNPSAVVQKYPAGADVLVFYDPNKPGSAVLEPGGSGLTALLVAGLVVILAGIVIGVIREGPPAGRSMTSYSSAMDLYNHSKFGEARPAFVDLAKSGSAEAKVYLGVIYAKGQGVPQDYVEAQKWFILAGDPGNKDREAMRQGLTSAQQQEAESKAKAWQ